jgi:hypothetical protein
MKRLSFCCGKRKFFIDAAIKLPKGRKPQWLQPELRVRVRHLAGGDTLRHASI